MILWYNAIAKKVCSGCSKHEAEVMQLCVVISTERASEFEGRAAILAR